jgi:hypothetical protein
MDNKQLIKVIKALVEVEVAKKQEKFLKEQFPAILDEAVKSKMKTLKKTTTKPVVSEEVDPFEMANQVLQNEREEQPKRQFTKNEALNEVLNQTQPFTKEQRAGSTQTKSVLDSFQKPQVNESMDKTVEFTQGGAGAGLDGIRASMTAQMGYGDMSGVGGSKQGGLGVQTGLAGLDRILNRDNSALVKKFKR